jgi:hypothetical protein
VPREALRGISGRSVPCNCLQTSMEIGRVRVVGAVCEHRRVALQSLVTEAPPLPTPRVRPESAF